MSIEKSNYQKRADSHLKVWEDEMAGSINRSSREMGIYDRTKIEGNIKSLSREIASKKELEFLRELKRENPEAGIYLVGGSVRDAILGRKSKDVDLLINRIDPVVAVEILSRYGRVVFDKNPNADFSALSREEKEKLLKETYGIIKFLPRDSESEELIDIGYPRLDDYTEAGRSGVSGIKNDAVSITDPNLPITEDLKRRDLTINAIAVNLLNGEIADQHGGIEDIIKGRIRAVGNPERILKEDMSRCFRAIRFACVFGADIEPDLKRIIRKIFRPASRGSAEIYGNEPEKLKKIKALEEDIRAEFGIRTDNLPLCLQVFWDKTQNKARMAVAKEAMGSEIMKAINADPVKFIEIMDETGGLDVVLPEVARLKGITQSPEHHREGDVFRHTMMVLRNLPPDTSFKVKLAAICHDLGKIETWKKNEDGGVSFKGHNRQSAVLTERLADRFRLKKNLKEDVLWLVQNHMEPILDNVRSMKNSTLEKKFLKSDDLTDDLITLARADSLGSIPEKGAPGTENVDYFAARISELRKKLSVGGRNIPPIVTGGELLKMGFEPGPRIREILEAVREEQLKGGIDQKDISLKYIDEIMAKKDSEDFINA
ncbi:MAG: HD domain-containing protein [Candidatus Falkowbacteria bacterium]